MQFSKLRGPTYYTKNSIMFPLSYISWNTLIGMGIWVDTVFALNIKLTLSGFTTESAVHSAGNLSWLALGI